MVKILVIIIITVRIIKIIIIQLWGNLSAGNKADNGLIILTQGAVRREVKDRANVLPTNFLYRGNTEMAISPKFYEV